MLEALKTALSQKATASPLETGEPLVQIFKVCHAKARCLSEGAAVCGPNCARTWLDIRFESAAFIQYSFRFPRRRKRAGKQAAAALVVQRYFRRMRASDDLRTSENSTGNALTSITKRSSIAKEAMCTEGVRIHGAVDDVEEAAGVYSPSWFGILVSQDNRAELSLERLDGKLLRYAERYVTTHR
mgnify:CR=1 FL=1